MNDCSGISRTGEGAKEYAYSFIPSEPSVLLFSPARKARHFCVTWHQSFSLLQNILNTALRAGLLTMAAVLLMATNSFSAPQAQTKLLSSASESRAQPQRDNDAPVPVAQEPHHHKVFENSYVRVFRVSIPADHETLLHEHDVPYVYVSLGPADIINAAVGKPEVHPKLADGQVGFSGPTVHVATALGMPFNNVTIELLHPQGQPENLCNQVVAAAPTAECTKFAVSGKTRSAVVEPQLRTPETEVQLVKFEGERCDMALEPQSLLIGLDDPGIQISRGDASAQTLRTGEVLWIGSGARAEVTNPKKTSGRYLQLIFKH